MANFNETDWLEDVGGSEAIADGRIKLINGSPISRISSQAVVLNDGREIPADVIILATG
jgi:putative flavoprotein involved in K+ transport